MTINRDNCEMFFPDYYEKNLSPVETAELLLFLEENPDLKEIFEEYETVFLEQEKLNFPDKEYLKKKFSGSGIDEILASEINRTNYEEFFIANAEEMLSDKQKEKLQSFLSENHDLQNIFLLCQKCKLKPEKLYFTDKESLKKATITEQNREEYFILSIENQLSESEEEKLHSFLQKYPKYQKEIELFRKTILVPGKTPFEWKSQLKRGEKKPAFVPIYFRQEIYYAAAASILLLIGLFFFFRNNDNNKTYTAEKINPAWNKIANVKPGSGNNTLAKNRENTMPGITTNLSVQDAEKKSPTTNARHFSVQVNPKTAEPNEPDRILLQKDKITFQPVISEDISADNTTAQEENPNIRITEAEKANILVQYNRDTPNTGTDNQKQPLSASANSNTREDEYISLSAFVNKKIKSLLGITNTNECKTSDKIGWWDVAMGAKNGVRKLIKTEALDVKKVCNSNGDKEEYVFTAGNFEFSKSAHK